MPRGGHGVEARAPLSSVAMSSSLRYVNDQTDAPYGWPWPSFERRNRPADRGSSISLHGGPGLNAIASRFPVNAARWPLARHRDIVNYDQRGTEGRATRYPIKDGAVYDIGTIYRDLGIAVP